MVIQRNNRERQKSSLLILITLCSFVHGFGQYQDRSTTQSDTKTASDGISCPVYMITVEVRIMHRNHNLELGKEDFVLYDNGEPQDIRMWTRIEGPGAQGREPIYAIAYSPPIYRFDGKLRKIRVVVRDKGKKRLRVKTFPRGYHATKELFGESSNETK